MKDKSLLFKASLLLKAYVQNTWVKNMVLRKTIHDIYEVTVNMAIKNCLYDVYIV